MSKTTYAQKTAEYARRQKDATVAVVLSLVVIGLGYVYLGKWYKMLGAFLLTIVFYSISPWLALIIYGVVAYNTYQDTEEINKNTLTEIGF